MIGPDLHESDRSFLSGGGQVDTSALGAFIRVRRKENGLTQKDLADLSGVSDRFVRELEKGKSSAEIGRVAEVLATLGYDLEPVIHQGGLA